MDSACLRPFLPFLSLLVLSLQPKSQNTRRYSLHFTQTSQLLDSCVACLPACLAKMAPEYAMACGSEAKYWVGNSVLDRDLWARFMENEEITADCPLPVIADLDMSSTKVSNSKPAKVTLTASDEEQAVRAPAWPSSRCLLTPNR